jgi:SAM-dependent methyltransferase
MFYLPTAPDQKTFSIPAARDAECRIAADGLPVPPQHLWSGYGSSPEEYVESGRRNVQALLAAVTGHGRAGFAAAAGPILDFGCSAGRMIRHLPAFVGRAAPLWGVDVSPEHVWWCKRHLGSVARFAATSLVPHLPFPDATFQLVYAGSVFTHIDDLADAWLLELRRVTRPGGRLYLTIHDEHTVALLQGREARSWLAHVMQGDRTMLRVTDGAALAVWNRGPESQVFYDSRWWTQNIATMFDVLARLPEDYGYQTAYVLERPAGP